MTPAAQNKLNEAIERTLRDAGLTSPPIRLRDVLEHLNLYQEFYDLSNPSFLDKTKHKLQVGGHKLVQIIKKVSLQAVLFFDENRIAIDESLPELKREWPGFHETGHKICPGHSEIFGFGDTAQTLNANYQEKLEAEANFVGAGVMFCGKHFTKEAYDTEPCWKTIDDLARRYGRTKTITLRRYTEFGPDCLMAGIIGTPYWKHDGPHAPGSCRHFVRSAIFANQFSNLNEQQTFETINYHLPPRTGKFQELPLNLEDDNGIQHEFVAEAFFNTYDLLILLKHSKKCNPNGCVIIP